MYDVIEQLYELMKDTISMVFNHMIPGVKKENPILYKNSGLTVYRNGDHNYSIFHQSPRSIFENYKEIEKPLNIKSYIDGEEYILVAANGRVLVYEDEVLDRTLLVKLRFDGHINHLTADDFIVVKSKEIIDNSFKFLRR